MRTEKNLKVRLGESVRDEDGSNFLGNYGLFGSAPKTVESGYRLRVSRLGFRSFHLFLIPYPHPGETAFPEQASLATWTLYYEHQPASYLLALPTDEGMIFLKGGTLGVPPFKTSFPLSASGSWFLIAAQMRRGGQGVRWKWFTTIGPTFILQKPQTDSVL